MKAITLKLTDVELNTITEIIKNDVDYLNDTTTYSCAGVTLPKWNDKDDFVNVVKVDKFIKFLNDEIAYVKGRLYKINRGDFKNLKSILCKLESLQS